MSTTNTSELPKGAKNVPRKLAPGEELIKAETIITAHNNADFDALASMVAASKIYPDSVLIFPGSQERTLRNFFIQSVTYMFNFQNIRDIDLSCVKRLVIVDTRQKSRLSHVHQVLTIPGLEVHAYDHHPDTDEDLEYSEGHVVNWGSTTTIIVDKMRTQDITLQPDEATVLGLGVYEDTGSFTFGSTTPKDYDAAKWLLGQGMDLNVISDLLNREMTATQVSVLNNLLMSASTHEINGVSIVMAEASMEGYMGDFALMAHKLLDMENIRVLFALGRMEDRVHVVARSRTPDVDVGQICSSLGGGGHGFAASASIKDRTLSQVKDELFGLLYSHINPQILVKDLMTQPVVSVELTTPMSQAVEVMSRYGFKAVPVVIPASKKVSGVLDHQLADKAVSHGLGAEKVEEYMHSNCAVINPESDLYPVMEIIVGQRQRLVPVVEDGVLVGVITRTDLVNTLIEEPARIPETLLPERSKGRNVRPLLKERLPKDRFALLQMAGELAEEQGQPVYAVGGFVRDLMLHRNNLDLDLVVEGDGIAYARALAAKLKGRVRSHPKFKTAVIIYKGPDGEEDRVDVATARLEYYEYPAALPTVELSSIKMDLFRRDFTVNALAVSLNPDSFGKLVDFFGSQRDIKERLIRVLHSLSFVEDPTRILRAIRFEQRFEFTIGGQTDRLIKNAVKLDLIQKLSGSRVFHELRLILDEERPLGCLRRMQHYGVLRAIHDELILTPAKEKILDEAGRVLNWYGLLYLDDAPEKWVVYLLCLCSSSNVKQTRSVATRLYFTSRQEQDFLHLKGQCYNTAEALNRWHSQAAPKDSELNRILEPVHLEGLLFLMARSRKEYMRMYISKYLSKLRGVVADITGTDVLEVAGGELPGPSVGKILEQVKDAKLDGEAVSREEQLDLACRLANDIVAQISLDPDGVANIHQAK